ncbi:MAG: hypothetical protein VYD19_07985, partial [Myxococcota bacterium]|nr:hypothetical protein [Myxococcota bacterium]
SERLQGELDLESSNHQETTQQLEQCRQELAETETQLTEQINTLRRELEQGQTLREGLLSDLEQTQSRLAGESDRVSAQGAEISSLEEALHAEQEQLRQAGLSIEEQKQTISSKQQQLDNAEEEIERLKEERAVLQSNKVDLEGERVELQTSLESTQSELGESQSKATELEEQLKVLEAAKFAMESELESERSRIAEIEGELQERLTLLSGNEAELEARFEELKNAKLEIERLENDLLLSRGECETFRADLDRERKERDEEERRVERERQERLEELSERDDLLASIRDDLSLERERVQSLSQDLQRLRRKSAQDIHGERQNRERLNRQVTRLNAQLSQFATLSSRVQETIEIAGLFLTHMQSAEIAPVAENAVGDTPSPASTGEAAATGEAAPDEMASATQSDAKPAAEEAHDELILIADSEELAVDAAADADQPAADPAKGEDPAESVSEQVDSVEIDADGLIAAIEEEISAAPSEQLWSDPPEAFDLVEEGPEGLHAEGVFTGEYSVPPQALKPLQASKSPSRAPQDDIESVLSDESEQGEEEAVLEALLSDPPVDVESEQLPLVDEAFEDEISQIEIDFDEDDFEDDLSLELDDSIHKEAVISGAPEPRSPEAQSRAPEEEDPEL